MGMLIHRRRVEAAMKMASSNIPIAELVVIEKPVAVEVEEVKEEKHYSRTEIQLMNVASIKELAKELGIEDADELSGNKLKPIIIKKLGL